MTTKEIEALVQRAENTMRSMHGDNTPTILVTEPEEGYYSVQLSYKKGKEEIVEDYAENFYESELEELITYDIPQYWDRKSKGNIVYVLINEYDHCGSEREHIIIGVFTDLSQAQKKMSMCVDSDISEYYGNDRSHIVEHNSLSALLQLGDFYEWDEYKIHIKNIQS